MMVDAGVRAELLFSKMEELGLSQEENEPLDDESRDAILQDEKVLDDVSLDNRAYLKSQLRYQPGILLEPRCWSTSCAKIMLEQPKEQPEQIRLKQLS